MSNLEKIAEIIGAVTRFNDGGTLDALAGAAHLSETNDSHN
ncbi:hypothetical protein [Paraburkholderia dinghuensis]|nr:hypothetical protein [Paraburkholderia dinghuensis]